MMRAGSAARQMGDLLAALNEAVRRADFEKVAEISAMLETIFLDFPDLNRTEAQRLRSLAARNLRCLEAAGEGVRAGRRRLREIAAARTGETYDRSGTRQTIRADDGNLGGRDLGRRL